MCRKLTNYHWQQCLKQACNFICSIIKNADLCFGILLYMLFKVTWEMTLIVETCPTNPLPHVPFLTTGTINPSQHQTFIMSAPMVHLQGHITEYLWCNMCAGALIYVHTVMLTMDVHITSWERGYWWQQNKTTLSILYLSAHSMHPSFHCFW